MENLSSSAAQPLNLPSAEGRRRTEMCMILFLKVIAAINVLALAGVCAYLAIEGLPRHLLELPHGASEEHDD